jgi:hypothetical protein
MNSDVDAVRHTVLVLWLMIVGFALELCGLGCAGNGLVKTWRANAPGRVMYPQWSSTIHHALARVGIRQTHTVSSSRSTSWDTDAVTVTEDAYVTQLLTAEMTTDDRIEAVQANAVHALEAAVEARQRMASEQRARERDVDDLRRKITQSEQTTSHLAKSLVVDGVPLAVFGLWLAFAGLVLQAVAGVATCGCT